VTLGGALDFQGNAAQSQRYLGAFAINTSTSQNIDITALIGPNDQAVVCVWAASGLFLTNAVEVDLVGASLPGGSITSHQLGDGQTVTMPFVCAVIPNTVGATLGLTVSPGTGTTPPATGTLHVLAQTAPPTVTATIRSDLYGAGATTSLVTVNAGATTTVLGLPSAGTFYRIKLLSWALVVAPAAAVALSWQLISTSATLFRTALAAAASQQSNIAIDLALNDGIKFVNPSSLNIPCSIAYEVWTN